MILDSSSAAEESIFVKKKKKKEKRKKKEKQFTLLYDDAFRLNVMVRKRHYVEKWSIPNQRLPEPYL
jgi:hypothetical protein